jgi:predicted DNA-binding antitoxin AbrB/MazE fold protein
MVEKVIKPHPGSHEPEKAQIAVEGADQLYRELRIPNKLKDEDGNHIKLKEGTEVEVKIETEHDAESPSS